MTTHDKGIDLKSLYFRLFAITVICGLGILIYANTLHSPFLFDDNSTISIIIANISNLGGIWAISPLRFVTHLTFALNYILGQLNVLTYHIFNLGVHLTTSLFVCWFTLLTLATPVMRKEDISKHSAVISLFAGLLFVTHPIHTQAITYIVQRAASLATLFYVASLCLYVKSRLLTNAKDNNILSWLCYITSVVLTAMGMFTKEIFITLPLMILLYELFFFAPMNKTIWLRAAPYMVGLFTIPTLIAINRSIYADWLKADFVGISAYNYLLTQFRVIVTYMRLLLFPVNQLFDYDYPIATSIFQLHTLSSLIFLLCIVIIALRMILKHGLISFCIFWFFITLLPESSILPIKDVIFEHRLYLPMVGFSIFAPVALYCILGSSRMKQFTVFLSILAISYSILTYNRNIIWNDVIVFWNDVIAKSPNKARPYNNRGVEHETRGAFDKALSDYNTAISMNSSYAEAYYNRAHTHQEKGNYAQAIDDYTRAVHVNPKYHQAYNNRGNVYQSRGNYEQAIADYTTALDIDAGYARARCNRGLAYLNIKKIDLAHTDLNRALEVMPDCTGAYEGRAGVYYYKKEYDKSWNDIRTAEALGYRVNAALVANLEKASQNKR